MCRSVTHSVGLTLTPTPCASSFQLASGAGAHRRYTDRTARALSRTDCPAKAAHAAGSLPRVPRRWRWLDGRVGGEEAHAWLRRRSGRCAPRVNPLRRLRTASLAPQRPLRVRRGLVHGHRHGEATAPCGRAAQYRRGAGAVRAAAGVWVLLQRRGGGGGAAARRGDARARARGRGG